MSTLHTSNDHAHAAHGHDAHGHGDHAKYPFLQHHFDSPAHQFDSAKLGMWLFLATEVLFFGGLFVAYAVLRTRFPEVFSYASHYLNTLMGGINTCVLILSSLTMALAVRCAQTNNRKGLIICLVLTFMGAIGFLVIKYFEYSEKFAHTLFPGTGFLSNPQGLEHIHGANANAAQLYFSMYFAMTGLHAVHIIIGILIISILGLMWFKRNKLVTEDFMPTEMIGLYWHFVDLVWIFLFPLYYLIPK